MDASAEFVKSAGCNQLAAENIARVAGACAARGEEDGFSRSVPAAAIAENDYTLSVSAYVERQPPRGAVDAAALNALARQAAARGQALRSEAEAILAGLDADGHTTSLGRLLASHCPNGVAYATLAETGAFYSGMRGKTKADFLAGGTAGEKYITYMNVFSNPALDTAMCGRVRIGEGERQNTVQYGDVLFTASSETPEECGMSSVLAQQVEEPLYLNSFCFGFRPASPALLLPQFSKYLFRSENIRAQIRRAANGVTRFNLSKSKMGRVRIPLPPTAVQREIVRILDTFTGLQAALQAELRERDRQYAHYRDTMLAFL